VKKTAKPLSKYPDLTWIYPLSPKANTVAAVRKIKDKLFAYGVISDREQAYLDRFGKIDQKNTFS